MAKTELRIKELCKRKGITQAQLAQELGIQPISFSQAVSRNKFNLDRLEEIAEILGVSIAELFSPVENVSCFSCPKCGTRLKIEEM